MTTEQLINTLTKAISFCYKDDKTAPGLTVSALKNGYYCSVVRYQGAFAKDKVVVCKAKSDTLDGALKSVSQQFLGSLVRPAKDPVDELASLLK